jgi:hypothetical protein
MFKPKAKRAVFITNKLPQLDDINHFIYKWNAAYPIDRWWRERHKVAFNSPAHRVVSFLDMYIEWQEEQLVIKAHDAALKQSEYKPGDWLTPHAPDVNNEIEEFEKLDLSRFDDKPPK